MSVVVEGRTGVLFGTEDFERLANIHPAVIQALGGPQLLGLPLLGWAKDLRPDELPFAFDEERQRLDEAIRAFALSSDETPSHLHIFGDTGVGKSRLVFQALSGEDLAGSVFVCPRADRVKTEPLEGFVNSEAVAILVVDDVSYLEARSLATYAAGARGRLRFITIGERTRRDATPGPATLEVPPLERGVVASLVSRVAGLTEDQAALVAELAEGYPKLAVELATALAGADDTASVVQLLQTANVGALLERMIPDPDARRHIAHLALVDRLGFDESLAFESDQLCEVFGLDRLKFASDVRTEQGRFVSDAGRYRLATPRALAMWLVRELMREGPEAFAERVVRLPEQLFEAFRRQIELLGDDPLTAEILTEVMSRKGNSFLKATETPPDFARLLRAISFAVPQVGATRILELVRTDDVEDLQSVDGEARRQFVWALAHLLWFETTFRASADALFRLAIAENEQYGNNATGTIVGAFGVHLGGTEVPLSERLDWLRDEYPSNRLSGSLLAVECAARALETMETRMGGWSGTRLQPQEWRPESVTEEQRVRTEALDLLLEIATEHSATATNVAAAIGRHFRALVSRGMAETAIEAIDGIEWGTEAKAELSSGLKACLYYDSDLPQATRDTIQGTLEKLLGESLDERLPTALATKYWDLAVGIEERLEGPPILEELAQSIADANRVDLVTKYAAPNPSFDETTLHALYVQIGSRGMVAAESIVSAPGISLAARTGYLIGRSHRGESDWVMDVLVSWTHNAELAGGVVMVVHQMPASGETLSLAIEPVEAGFASLSSLNQLLFGAWVKPLSPEELDSLLSLYASRALDGSQLDAALHMLLFWLDGDGNRPTEALLETATSLLLQSTTVSDGSGGLAYVRTQLLERLSFSDDQQLEFALAALQQKTFPHEDELRSLEALAQRAPQVVISAVVELLLSDEYGWSLYLERANLLSRLAVAAGVDTVVATVASESTEGQDQLLRHLDFLGSGPDPVFLALLDTRQDETFLQEAGVRFLYPGEVVVGSYADYLEGRLAQLRRWADSSDSLPLKGWAKTWLRRLRHTSKQSDCGKLKTCVEISARRPTPIAFRINIVRMYLRVHARG